VRLTPEDPTPRDQHELLERWRSFQRDEPDLAREMMGPVPAAKKRAYMEIVSGGRWGYRPLPSDVPILNVPKRMSEDVKAYAKKLAKALHYRHTGQIVPEQAAIFVRWHTGMNILEGTFPEKLLDIIRKPYHTVRNGGSLSDQFQYRGEVSDDGTFSAFFCQFRQAFFTTMLLSFDPVVLAGVAEKLGPVPEGASFSLGAS
jgi:hypothetical protein